MNRIVTKGIILNRINYSDSDRILSVITLDNGKISLIAKGVRKIKSKLAGGIEIFGVFEAIFIKGRGEIDTLVSARSIEYFTNIINDINRLQVGYKILKIVDLNTREHADNEHFMLLETSLKMLNNLSYDPELVLIIFMSKLVSISGLTPNLEADDTGLKLKSDHHYNFDVVQMRFTNTRGLFDSNTIKILRILFSNQPERIFKIEEIPNHQKELSGLLQAMLKEHLYI